MLNGTRVSQVVTVVQNKIFSKEQLSSLDLHRVPKHIAIIMDGNRRWAKERNLPAELGHANGARALKEAVQAAAELGVKTLTVFSFSTENKNRPQEEIKGLLNLFKEYLISEKETMIENGIAFHTIGDISYFPEDLVKIVDETKKETSVGRKLNLVVAVNYGSRDEIVRAVQKVAQDALDHKIQPKEVSEEVFAQYLDTASFSDPDLLIRTSGEFRISNFLLWQISYSEISVLRKYWPDFQPDDLLSTIKEYQARERRCGV